MTIVAYRKENHDQLVAIWLRAVRSTHHFLSEEDIEFYHHIVTTQALTIVELWMALNETGQPVGFIGLEGSKVAMLFVDPQCHGRGIGSQLLDYATDLKGMLTLDVNEQNPTAVAFYRHYGFEQTGRSALDTSGRPFPLLHMTLNDSRKRY